MFNNYLVLNEAPEVMLYLFINEYSVFKKYYNCLKSNKKKLIKNINSYINNNKINYNGSKATIVIEGIITNVIDIN